MYDFFQISSFWDWGIVNSDVVNWILKLEYLSYQAW